MEPYADAPAWAAALEAADHERSRDTAARRHFLAAVGHDLRSPLAALRAAVEAEFEELLCDADAEVLERNSRDVAERVQVINRNAAELSERLSRHPADI